MSETGIPKHNGLLFNPHLTFLQKIISFCIDYFLDLKNLGLSIPGTEKSNKILHKNREMMKSAEEGPSGKASVKAWSDVYSSPLAEATSHIPFRKDILHDWNIVEESTCLPSAFQTAKDRTGVPVLVRFPASLLTTEMREKGNISELSGCLEVSFDKIDWKTFRPDVPVLIHFHGGGMCFGGKNESIAFTDAAKLTKLSATPADLIIVSVDYSLAPENPFPIGVMDALSVMDYFLSAKTFRRGIHISGLSAGGNLSLVAGLEAFRRFPGKILSIQSQSPFLDPAGDSMSYYMNQKVYPNVTWLRWAWQIYLGLERPTESQTNENSLESVLRMGSNHSSWKKWRAKFPSKGLHRLVNPLLELLDGLDGKDAPTIIVRYNLGDPLHSDGRDCEKAFLSKAGANAKIFEHAGIHCDIAGKYDPKPGEFWDTWWKAIFRDDNA